MKRYDLRHLKSDFLQKMSEIIDKSLKEDEVGIFLFEKSEHDLIHKAIDIVKSKNLTILNSLAFNRVDWTLTIKNTKEEPKNNAEKKVHDDISKNDISNKAQEDVTNNEKAQ